MLQPVYYFFFLEGLPSTFKEENFVLSSVLLKKKIKSQDLQSLDFFHKKKSPREIIFIINYNTLAGAAEGKSYLGQGERHGSSRSALFFNLSSSEIDV